MDIRFKVVVVGPRTKQRLISPHPDPGRTDGPDAERIPGVNTVVALRLWGDTQKKNEAVF